ncbi:MAG: M42 family metallopeptidase [Ruminococcus sp.]
MLNHFETLCNLCAVSGDEQAVRSYLISVLEKRHDVTWTIDPLGSLLVEKRGQNRAPHKLMVSAHMDEVGMIVLTSTAVCCDPAVGGVDASVVIGRRFWSEAHSRYCRNKPVHLLSRKAQNCPPLTDWCWIWASSAERHNSPEGTCLFRPDFPLGNGRVCSKAIDDRAGCACCCWVEGPYDITAAFLVQEEIGLRGATAAAYTVTGFALVLEATTARISSAHPAANGCCLGGGPVVSLDRSTIYDKELYRMAFSLAEKNGISCQTKSRIAGGNDSGAIHVSRGGVRTLAISLPCRYLHSPSCLADLNDLDACTALLPLLVKSIMEEVSTI